MTRCEAAVRALGLTPSPVPLPPLDVTSFVMGRFMSVMDVEHGGKDWTLAVPVKEAASPVCHVTAAGYVTVQKW